MSSLRVRVKSAGYLALLGVATVCLQVMLAESTSKTLPSLSDLSDLGIRSADAAAAPDTSPQPALRPETSLDASVTWARILLGFAPAVLNALIAVWLLARVGPGLARDTGRLHRAIRSLGAGFGDLETGAMNHREFAECAEELRTAAQRIRVDHEALRENAFHDALTGLPNRRPFMDSLARESSTALRTHRPLSLVMADLDHFKTLNDTYGHQLGDRVLKHVAGRFSSLVRESDMVARFGGEEFSILLPGASLETALEVTHQLRNALRCDPLVLEGERLHVSASFGVAEMQECRLSEPEHLLHHADMALYEAKRQGRDRVVVAASVGESNPAAATECRSDAEVRLDGKAERERVWQATSLDQDTLALMGCTFSVLQVIPDKHRVVRDMIQQVATVLQSDRVSVFLVNQQAAILIPVAALGTADFDKTAPVPLPSDLRSWFTDLSGAPAGAEGVPGPIFVHADESGQDASAVYLPVAEYDDVLAVIVATALPADLKLSARQRSVLGAICAIGASALKSCEMFSRLERHWIGSVGGLCTAIQARCHGQGSHVARVSEMCLEIARYLGREDKEELQLLNLASNLYDIGKIEVPSHVLDKKGRLRAGELTQMRDHCRLGAAIVSALPGLDRLAQVVLHHHEHFDGNGYPEGLKGDRIPLESRIIAVADAYEAMISERPYRRAISHRRAIETILAASGTQFDPEVVEAFMNTQKVRSIQDGPIGTQRDGVSPAAAVTAGAA